MIIKSPTFNDAVQCTLILSLIAHILAFFLWKTDVSKAQYTAPKPLMLRLHLGSPHTVSPPLAVIRTTVSKKNTPASSLSASTLTPPIAKTIQQIKVPTIPSTLLTVRPTPQKISLAIPLPSSERTLAPLTQQAPIPSNTPSPDTSTNMKEVQLLEEWSQWWDQAVAQNPGMATIHSAMCRLHEGLWRCIYDDIPSPASAPDSAALQNALNAFNAVLGHGIIRLTLNTKGYWITQHAHPATQTASELNVPKKTITPQLEIHANNTSFELAPSTPATIDKNLN